MLFETLSGCLRNDLSEKEIASAGIRELAGRSTRFRRGRQVVVESGAMTQNLAKRECVAGTDDRCI